MREFNSPSRQFAKSPSAQVVLLGRHPRRTAFRVAVLVILALGVFGWVLTPIRAEGISMRPTFAPGTLHFLNRLAFLRRPPARGDVVGIRLAGPHAMYVKRIVGLPGERVRIARGQVLVDEAPLTEPQVVFRNPSWNMPAVALSPDEYFVVGDNRSMAMELHDFGRTKRTRIIGRVVF